MERAFFAAYPTITVINVADVLNGSRASSTRSPLWSGCWPVFRFLPGSRSSPRASPARASAACRRRSCSKRWAPRACGSCAPSAWSSAVLGLLAGAVGVVFANLLTRVLLHRLDVAFQIEWGATLMALVGTAVLATATGWIASYRILGLRPLEVLREE